MIFFTTQMESFAERQLKKFGWKKGDSLGKSAENGLKRPIVVELKQDLLGIGSSNQSDCWWDHQYNKTSQEMNIVTTNDSCSVSKTFTAKDSAKTALFGTFLKSTGNLKDFSIKITDEELFEACGRRSCRKGARGLHDITTTSTATSTATSTGEGTVKIATAKDDSVTKTTGGDDEKARKALRKAEKAKRKAEKVSKKARKAARALKRAGKTALK
jgi:G-patch domain